MIIKYLVEATGVEPDNLIDPDRENRMIPIRIPG